MPTLILLDCGLSMGRLVGKKEAPRSATAGGEIPEIILDDDTEIRHLAIQGITQLLARIETNCRLEHVALVTFSSTAEVLAPFTRDIDLVRSKLASVTAQDKSLLEAGLGGAVGHVLDEWGGGATESLNLNMVTILLLQVPLLKSHCLPGDRDQRVSRTWTSQPQSSCKCWTLRN